MDNSIQCIGARKVPYVDDDSFISFEYKLRPVVKEFRALKADFENLPTDGDMASGSRVLFLDTGEYAEYCSFNKTWYMINQSSGVDINAIKKELGLDNLDGNLLSVKT